jgi:hypothetical protein
MVLINIRKQSAVVIFLTSWISKAEKFSIPNPTTIWVLSFTSKQIERKMIVSTFALSFNPLQLLVLKVFSFPTLWNYLMSQYVIAICKYAILHATSVGFLWCCNLTKELDCPTITLQLGVLTSQKHVDRSHLLLSCPSEVPFACQAYLLKKLNLKMENFFKHLKFCYLPISHKSALSTVKIFYFSFK